MSEFAAQSLLLLRTLPVPLAALLMQQVLRYGTMFPRERHELEATLASLQPPRSAEKEHAVAAFAALRLSAGLKTSTWENDPASWMESFTAEMWSTGQIGALRDAARLVLPVQAADAPDAQRRAVVVVFDKRLQADGGAAALFRRLRPAGTHFAAVGAKDADGVLRQWLTARADAHAEPYAHWMVCGEAVAALQVPKTATLSYAALQPARQHLLHLMNEARNEQGGGGPEGLRHAMQQLKPQQMGLPADTDPVLAAFATDVLTGGSGTQLYATTFVQWTAREVLRRAQPRTLVARFTPRNQSASMDMRLAHPTAEPPLDGAGSLLDAEMGAHLTQVNLQRLPGAERAHFLAWHEGYGQAVLIGEGVAAGVETGTRTSLRDLLQRMA